MAENLTIDQVGVGDAANFANKHFVSAGLIAKKFFQGEDVQAMNEIAKDLSDSALVTVISVTDDSVAVKILSDVDEISSLRVCMTFPYLGNKVYGVDMDATEIGSKAMNALLSSKPQEKHYVGGEDEMKKLYQNIVSHRSRWAVSAAAGMKEACPGVALQECGD